jgi:hypothetical protein
MLYAKITPVAERIEQITPFSAVTQSANYMSALARPYGLGSDSVNFEVIFGNITFDENNQPVRFQNVLSNNLKLTAEQLQSWGTDDSVVLQQIASILGITIDSYAIVPNDRI